MKKNSLYKGIAIMLLSSGMTCLGQLCWKLASVQGTVLLLLLGFAFYGCGAVCMILALRYGDLSILHPMLSAGYVLSFVLGAIVLQEQITWNKVVGVIIIICGLILISTTKKEGL